MFYTKEELLLEKNISEEELEILLELYNQDSSKYDLFFINQNPDIAIFFEKNYEVLKEIKILKERGFDKDIIIQYFLNDKNQQILENNNNNNIQQPEEINTEDIIIIEEPTNINNNENNENKLLIEETNISSTTDITNYSEMSITELMKIAKERRIKYFRRMTKEELILVLKYPEYISEIQAKALERYDKYKNNLYGKRRNRD